MIKSNDDFLYNLNRPMMMAGDDEDDDLFEDDDLSDEALDDDIDLNVSDSDDEDDDLPMAAEKTSVGSAESKGSTGITRNAVGFGALTLTGIIPLVLLILYMIQGGGLSWTSMLFLGAFFVGFALSVWTFLYYRSGVKTFTRFDVHSYFKWPEIIVISVVLLAVSFINLGSLYSGDAVRLSSESTIKKANSPEPVYAPEPPQGFEYEEEVLYTSPEFSTSQDSKVTQPAPVQQAQPARKQNTVRQQPQRAQTRTFREVKPVARPAATASKAENNSDSAEESVMVAAEGSAPSVDEAVDDAVNIAEISASTFEDSGASTTGQQPVSTVQTTVETTPLVSSLFLGGVLCAALGYAFPLAIAGAILGLFRKFNNPFAAKTEEIVNEETGEVTLATEEQTMVNKIVDHVFRLFVGFNIGGTVGFILGLVITLPLYFLFWDKAQVDPIVSNILMTVGVVKNPDLAYAAGFIVAGIMVPVIMLVVGKASPAGMTITEENIRSVYTPIVNINKSAKDLSAIPEPAIISFDLEDGDSSSSDDDDDDDFAGADSKESLTQDLLSEFGVELENVFGMKVAMPAKSNGDNGKISNYEKQKVNSVLEKSLGELGNVSVQVSAELGKATIMLTDWLNLSEGMLIELDKPVSEEIDILINDVCKGKGRLTVADNHLAVEVSKAEFSQSRN